MMRLLYKLFGSLSIPNWLSAIQNLMIASEFSAPRTYDCRSNNVNNSNLDLFEQELLLSELKEKTPISTNI